MTARRSVHRPRRLPVPSPRAPGLRRLGLRLLGLGLLGSSLVAGMAGCHKGTEKKADDQSTEAKSKKSSNPADEGVDVPTEEDFEEAAAKQITPDSDLQKELDQLEKEIK